MNTTETKIRQAVNLSPTQHACLKAVSDRIRDEIGFKLSMADACMLGVVLLEKAMPWKDKNEAFNNYQDAFKEWMKAFTDMASVHVSDKDGVR